LVSLCYLQFNTSQIGSILSLKKKEMKAAIDARQAAIRLGSLSTKAKSEALYEIHKELDARKEAILKANRLDVEVFRTQ
jgi:gamma-glutamyl phosphate reductase